MKRKVNSNTTFCSEFSAFFKPFSMNCDWRMRHKYIHKHVFKKAKNSEKNVLLLLFLFTLRKRESQLSAFDK